MKKMLCVVGFLVLAARLPLRGYDTSPYWNQVVPEAVWASATGGGTWVTELQITSFASTAADIKVWFDTSGGSRGSFLLHTGLAQHQSVRFSNILATIDALDTANDDYYGRVGALYFETVDSASRIHVQAKTVNGNYGKTFPGINIAEGNTAAEGRPLIIQDLVMNATFRTSVGIYNPSENTYTVRLTIIDANGVVVGTYFDKSLGPYAFLSFNPFVQAGITSGTYENCWLLIAVTSGGSGTQGVMCYGSIANNITNDTYALIAQMYN